MQLCKPMYKSPIVAIGDLYKLFQPKKAYILQTEDGTGQYNIADTFLGGTGTQCLETTCLRNSNSNNNNAHFLHFR